MIYNCREELCSPVCRVRTGGARLGGWEGRGEEKLPPTQLFHPGWVWYRLQIYRAFREKKQTPLVFHILSSLQPLSFHTVFEIQKSIALEEHISTDIYICCMTQ